MIRYVNCRKEICTQYCGRPESFHKAIGNPINLSILGNPEFLTCEQDRICNIKRYAKYLANYCRRNPHIIDILKIIPNDAILGCFCFPKDCHCRVIIDAIQYFKRINK